METAERIEELAASMREFTRNREELDSFALGAIRGCVDGDHDAPTVLGRIQEVFAALALVRAERR